jgi:hypothetical protein
MQSNSNPSSSGCPRASYHKWINLGPVGNDNYQCKKCGTLLKAARMPSSTGCPQGPYHQWTKL